MKLTKYSHHFVVRDFTHNEKSMLRRFIKPLVQVTSFRNTRGELITTNDHVFAASNALRTEYRFHINQYEQFLEFMKAQNNGESPVKNIKIIPMYEPTKVEIPMAGHMTPRENDQLPIINYFLDDKDGVVNKMTEAQPGLGKSYLTVYTVSVKETIAVLFVKPKFIGSWMEGLIGKKRTTDLYSADIMVIQGSGQLKDAIQMALDGELTAKFIIISNTTMANFIKEYEKKGNLLKTYGCNPQDLMAVLGAGIAIKDEIHKDFHLFFKIDLYLHCPLSISLSGTFSSNDPFIRGIQQMLHPEHKRAPKTAYNRYINVMAIRYGVQQPSKLSWTLRGRNDYNHNKFESEILKNSKARVKWLDLIAGLIEYEYIRIAEKGEKCIVMCSSVDMCDAVVSKFVGLWGDKLGVQRFCQGDDFKMVLLADIVVTTIMSGSTAIDVPGLRVGLNTVNVGSKESNEQALFRLRYNPNFTPVFMYMFTDDIASAGHYHQKKLQEFKDRVLSHATRNSGVVL